jgi:Fe-S-cluster containining protein
MPVETPVTPAAQTLPWDRLQLDDRFTFRCSPDLDCFTKCCRDVTIVLTPYDVLRMKRAAGLDSSEFLDRYTLTPCFPEQKFPIVILKMNDDTRECPFVCEQGCKVYNDRPWSCRMYPLGAAEPKNPSEKDQPFHFVILEDICNGHKQAETRTVREWMASQGAEAYEMMSSSFKELTLHDFWDGKETLSPEGADMFYMACYDLDRFRKFVFETRFLQLFNVDEARIEALRTDDEELLDFGVQWLRFSLFKEHTMRLRKPPENGRSKE